MNAGKGTALITVTMVLGVLMDGIDGSIVNVALPAIAHGFGTDTSVVSWVTISYFLLMAGFLLPFGRIASAGHIRKVFLFGFAVFTIGSVACALSPTLSALIASRVVQGLGAAAIAAVAPMICVKVLPPEHLGRSLGIMSVAASMGFALGPALGGLIVEFLSWHWIFFINVPIGLVAAFIALKALPRDSSFDRSAFDYNGSVLLFLSLIFGLYALESMPSHGVTTTTVASLALFAVLFSVFLLYERRQTVQVLRLRLFRSGRFVAVSVSFLILNACYMGCLYLLPYFMRVELGFDTIMCGIMLLIAAVMTLVFCLKVGRMADLRGNRPFVIAGCFLMVVAMTIFALMSADVPLWVLVVGVAVLGTVWGVAGGPVGSRLIENVPSDERGSGSSVLSFFIYFGSALGTALFSGLFGFGSASAGQPIAGLDPAVFMDGFSFAMAFGVALAVIGLITAVAVNERRSA